VFVAFSAVMVINAVYREPTATGLGILVIAAGIPLYLWYQRRTRR
jgi:hypothetical protein